MSNEPTPLTPADCDLRNFAYLPLDVVRLRDSDIAGGDHTGFHGAVLLWCASWHQVPAASLPNDDAKIARLAGYGRDVRNWKRARNKGALHGWVLCSDGRLYHPVVAEKAMEAWTSKAARAARTEAARLAAQANRDAEKAAQYQVDHECTQPAPDLDPSSTQCGDGADYTRDCGQPVDNAQCDMSVTASKGEGTEGRGNGREESKQAGREEVQAAVEPPPPPPAPAPLPAGDYGELVDRICDIAGLDQARTDVKANFVDTWLRMGLSADVIVDVVGTVAGGRRRGSVRSLNYFHPAMTERLAADKARGPQLAPSDSKAFDAALAAWGASGCKGPPPAVADFTTQPLV